MTDMKESSDHRRHGKGAALGMGGEKAGCRMAGRVWVQHGEETFLAWGRVVLLEHIGETGSINAAAKAMGMGFRHAWLLVDQMNRVCPKPLVEKTTGGRGGGGTILTDEGRRVIDSFWKMVDSFNRWLSKQDPCLWELSKPVKRKTSRKPTAAKKARTAGKRKSP